MKINVKKQASTSLINTNLLDSEQTPNNDWFEADYWQKQDLICGQAKGRFITWFIKPFKQESVQWVLRHYYRGGLVAKLSKDSFFYTGIKNTRCYLEVSLLLKMFDLNLPVPKPVAARVIKKGLFYQADLLMEKLDAVDLCGVLKERSLSSKEWNNIGDVIANFHSNGVYHSDLNAHNVMLGSSGKVWLIDFDRCEIRKNKTVWQQQNLARLKRSFLKEKTLHSNFYFDEKCWGDLIDGYES